MGIEIPPAVQGRSLRPLWEGEEGWPPAAALSESLSESEEKKSLRGDRYKLVVHLDAETVARSGRSQLPDDAPASLYDLEHDPLDVNGLSFFLRSLLDPAAIARRGVSATKPVFVRIPPNGREIRHNQWMVKQVLRKHLRR